MKYTAHEHIKFHSCLVPKAYSAAATTGTAVDTKGYSEAVILLHAGAAAANAEADVTVYEGTTRTLCTTQITAATFAQVTPTAATNIVTYGRLDLRNRKRWLNVKNAGDGSNAVTLGVSILLLGAASHPVTQTATEGFDF